MVYKGLLAVVAWGGRHGLGRQALGELTRAELDATSTQPDENRTVPPQIRRVGVKISSVIV